MNFQSRYGPGWVVITGGADGIGRAYAQYFAEKQFSVILIDRNSVLLNATVNDIKRRFKVKAHAIEADLSSYAFNPELYDGVYSRIKELVAGENVVGLINNVGVGYIEKFEKFPLE
jgi:short-subunit dehydrogenase